MAGRNRTGKQGHAKDPTCREAFEIVGVMPAGFELLRHESVERSGKLDTREAARRVERVAVE